MSFLCNIKLGQVTNLSDARYAAAVGIEYIGFCFDPSSEHYVAPIKAREMIDWITGSHIVAEFGQQSADEIRDISELLQVDVIELNNRLLPDEVPALGKAVIKKINLNDWNEEALLREMEAYHTVCDAFHLYQDNVEVANPELLKQLCSKYKIILGLPLPVSEVIETIHTYQPFGIHVSGGMEEKAGIKDFDELNDLIDILTVED